jgi:hypothetical protein
MNTNENDPGFTAIEGHIRRARAQRSVAIGVAIGELVATLMTGLKHLAESAGSGLAAERDRRAIEADAFLKRSVPRY